MRTPAPSPAPLHLVTRLAVAATLLLGACDSTKPNVPTRLEFTGPPLSGVAGLALTVTVEVKDARGQLVTTATNSITLSLGSNPSGVTLGGTTTVAAVNGVASFTNLYINRPGNGYTLVASAANLTGATSAAFGVVVGVPAKLEFLVQPGQVSAGTPFAPAVMVAVQDAAGNIVTSATLTVTLTLALNPGGATLSGTTTVAAVNGVAVFSDVRVDKVASGYILAASAPNLAGASSAGFNVLSGPPARLEFRIQPAPTLTGAFIAPGIVVDVTDAGGNRVLSAANSVTLALGANPGGATLSGTTTVSAVAGAATFSGLTIDNPGVGYTLVATSGALTGATSAPFTIRASLIFSVLSAGYFHSCGVAIGNAGWCWGTTSDQLGNGTAATTGVPVAVAGGISFVSISAGRDHSCGLTAAGAAWCWGFNGNSALGDGTTTNRATPVAVAGGLTWAAVTAGYAHTCGVTVAGAAYCWGNNGSGGLGDGTAVNRLVPTAVSGGRVYRVVSVGRFFTCGVTTGNEAFCWGSNFNGELGNGTTFQSTTPTLVAGGIAFATVGAGGFHSCGLSTAGAALCWGANSFSELGTGTTTPSLTPVAASGGLVFASLSVGNRHNCAVTAAGAAFCWGGSVIGDGTTAGRSVPTAVVGGLVFASISAGRFNTCGVTTSNLGYCWGSNSSGQSGLGSASESLVPARVR